MNAVEEYAIEHCLCDKLTEAQLVNRLQDENVISDNCVWLEDIAESDHARVIKWLKHYVPES